MKRFIRVNTMQFTDYNIHSTGMYHPGGIAYINPDHVIVVYPVKGVKGYDNNDNWNLYDLKVNGSIVNPPPCKIVEIFDVMLTHGELVHISADDYDDFVEAVVCPYDKEAVGETEEPIADS